MTYPTPVGRGRPVARRALLLSCALVAMTAATSIVIASSAAAQSSTQQPTPPRDYNVDYNGVDLVTGKLYLASTDLTIGSGESRLSYSRNRRALGYDDQYDTALNVDGSTITISIGGLTDTFATSGGNSQSGTGAMLASVNGDYAYTTTDGVKYTFKFTVRNERYRMAQYRVTDIEYPNGRKLVIEYDSSYYEFCNELGCGGSFHYSRPIAVSSNDGYRLLIKYLSDVMDAGAGSGPQFEKFMTVAGVTATNAAEEYCTTANCPPGGSTWASTQYAWNTSSSEETHIDPLGRSTVTSVDSAGHIVGLRLPGDTNNAATITYDTAGRVETFVTGVGTWTYAYADNGNVRTTIVTSPTGLQRVIESDLTKDKVIRDNTGTGGTTQYAYDDETRLTMVIAPEGNSTSFTYDAFDNVTSTVTTRKDGGDTFSALSSFPVDCANLVLCHRPTSTTDANGKVTNYDYDPVHGGVTKIRRPAPYPGFNRPETRFAYEQLYAWYKNASGILTQAASPIWKLVSISECASGVAPTCIGTSSETRTEITYGTPGTPNNLLPTIITVRAGNGAVSASNAMTYDRQGNVVAVDGPLPGTQDTSVMRYNLARETIGMVTPDPDGAGPLKPRAMRNGRDAMGRVTSVDVGTVMDTSDAAWSSFSVLQTATNSYDPTTRLKTQEALVAGGATRRLIQFGYDADGRIRCTTVRIGLAASADPCQQLGSAATGYDQVAETIYGTDGRISKTREGGVDTASATYTPNGQIATLTDGENNRTTYEYDGFDRLFKTRYPLATKGMQASSTTDYEQLGYDANGNVTSRRLRDGSSIGYSYDALSRLTGKDLPGSELDVLYGYDLLSRPFYAATSAQALVFSYDALGRNLTQFGPLGTVSAEYDAAGRRTRLNWPDGFYVSYDYLVTGEMTAIREQGAASGTGVLATFGYDDLGQRTSLTRGNGTSTNYAYDPVSRLTALGQDLPGSGNDLSLGFTYNPASQITGTTRSNDTYTWNGHYNRSTAYGINGLNQATSAGDATIGYDARGNTTSIGSSAYTYSAENLLLTGPSSATLIHDPLARLYQTDQNATTRFLYDGLDMVGEYDASNALQRRYVFGPGTDEPLVWYEGAGIGDKRWLHADERGSVIAVTNSSGSTLATNNYDEYGAPALNNLGRFGYTGQARLPELGMWYYKARIYNPKLGRFMQTDPIGYSNGPNLYNYVGSDPVNRTDPSGLLECVANEACSVGHRMHYIFGGADLGYGGWWGGGNDTFGRDLAEQAAAGDSGPADAPKETPQSKKLTQCSVKIAAKHLAAAGLPTSGLANVRTHSALNGDANLVTRFAYRGGSSVTQGSNIYKQPGITVTTLFEEISHTAQFEKYGTAMFYLTYGAASYYAADNGKDMYEQNFLERQAKDLAGAMARDYNGGKGC